jgi:hypothetical protein
MPPFPSTSILVGLDTNRTGPIRRLLDALAYRLAGTPRQQAEEQAELGDTESVVVDRVYNMASGHELLTL